jgi:hypothetical protein
MVVLIPVSGPRHPQERPPSAVSKETTFIFLALFIGLIVIVYLALSKPNFNDNRKKKKHKEDAE